METPAITSTASTAISSGTTKKEWTMTPRPERLGSAAVLSCPEEPLLPGRVLCASVSDAPSGPATAAVYGRRPSAVNAGRFVQSRTPSISGMRVNFSRGLPAPAPRATSAASMARQSS